MDVKVTKFKLLKLTIAPATMLKEVIHHFYNREAVNTLSKVKVKKLSEKTFFYGEAMTEIDMKLNLAKKIL